MLEGRSVSLVREFSRTDSSDHISYVSQEELSLKVIIKGVLGKHQCSEVWKISLVLCVSNVRGQKKGRGGEK